MDKGYWDKIYVIGFFCLSILLLPHWAFSQSLEEAKRLNDEVIQLYQQGRYQEAIPLAKQALEIRKKALGPDHPDIATGLNNLAGLYYALGDYAKAEPLYVRALKIREKTLGQDHPHVASSLNNLAELYDALGDYAKAEPLYVRALETVEKALGPEHPHIAGSLNNLALLYLEDKRPDKAFEILKLLDSPMGLGLYYLAKSQFSNAEREFSRSLKSSEKTKEKDFIIASCIGLGLSLEGQGDSKKEGLEDYQKARAYFQKGIDIIESQWHTLSRSAKKFFLTGQVGAGFSRLDAYEGLIRVLLKEKPKGHPKEALAVAERVKGRILLEMLATRDIKGKTKEDEEILKRYREYQKAFTILTARLEAQEETLAQKTLTQKILAQKAQAQKAQAENAPLQEKKGIQEKIGKIRQSLQEKEQEYIRFIEEIKPRNPELASLISVVIPPIGDIQKRLDKDTTLIEYYTAKDKTYVWLIAKNDIRVHTLSFGKEALQKTVNNLLLPNISKKRRRPAPHILKLPTKEYTKETTEKELEENRKRYYEHCRNLYDTLFAPIAQRIKTQKLIIVPHGVLHKVPFAALTDGEAFLTDRYQISLLPSASTLCYLKKKKGFQNRLLAFANPYKDQNIPYNPSLFHAEEEADAISLLFKKHKVYKRAEATETRLKQNAIGYDVIHMGAHAEFNENYPLLSHILLTKDPANDGLFQVHEAFELNLPDAHLVTASCCETALCRMQGGDDLVGLSRGFFYAGTPSLLATLWEVNDKSTSIFMEYFYKNWLNGMSKPEALRQAQIKLKKSESYSHPYYWAPFVMFGD